MTSDIESIIAQAKPAEDSVPLCLDGPLVDEYERLEVELRDAGPAKNLGDENSAEAIAERMEALRQRMLEGRVWFRFRQLDKKAWKAMKAALPSKDDGQSDDAFADAYHVWTCRLIAATCYEPEMTAEQADRLFIPLSDGQWGALSGAAWAVNTANQPIPFSAAASALTRRSAGRSRRPAPPATDTPSSLADSSGPSPNSSTTTATG